MTLLVQTDGRVKQRKARRKQARTKLVNESIRAALDAAFAEIDRIQTPLVNVSIGATGTPTTTAAAPIPPQSTPVATAAEGGGAPVAAGDPSESAVMMSDSRTRAAVEQAAQRLHDYYREEFRQVLRGMAGRLQVQMEEKEDKDQDQDLLPDTVLEKLRRLVPSEFLVAWAVWTAAARMADSSKLNATVQWIVWVVYGLASFVYVLILLIHGRWLEECKDCAPPPAAADAAAAAAAAAAANLAHVSVLDVADASSAAAANLAHVSVLDVADASSAAAAAAAAAPAAADTVGTAAPAVAVPGAVVQAAGTAVGGAKSPPKGVERMPGSPSNWWLGVQAFASMLSFFLLSAATGDIYLQEEALMWTLVAVTPLFALFSQFVVPDGIMPMHTGAQ